MLKVARGGGRKTTSARASTSATITRSPDDVGEAQHHWNRCCGTDTELRREDPGERCFADAQPARSKRHDEAGEPRERVGAGHEDERRRGWGHGADEEPGSCSGE